MAAPASASAAGAAPAWTTARLPIPPTALAIPRSMVFDRLSSDEKFELFKVLKPQDEYRQRSSLTCGICAALLYDPVVCEEGCSFLACGRCWREHFLRDDRCPQCRAVQTGEARVAKHLVSIIDEDLLTQGVQFECNADLPGSHPTALWPAGA